MDFRHCRLNEAIALELGNKLLVRNGRLVAPLGYHGQIFQVFQQFLVVGDWKNHGRTFAAVIGDVFNSIAHHTRLAETEATRNPGREKFATRESFGVATTRRLRRGYGEPRSACAPQKMRSPISLRLREANDKLAL